MSTRVLFLTPWYPDDRLPHHGVFVRDQASTLGKDLEVAVISSKVDYTSFKLFSWRIDESRYEGIKEYRLVINRSIPLLNQVNYLLISIWFAYTIGKKFKPQIVHGNIAYPGGIWAYCTSFLLSCPFVVSDHTSRFTDNFRSAFHRWSTIFSLRRAGKVIAVSSWAAKNITDVIHREVQVIPNLIHVKEYAITDNDEATVQIGFLGGLSSEIHRKGLDILLTAIAPVTKDFVLHIGGQGRYLQHYKDMAQSLGVISKCRFHGFVPYVPEFMRHLHFFVSASRLEAFGMVIAEAMACGLPVVTTDSGGPADFIDVDCGRMVPVGDVQSLRDEIEWMIDHYHTFDRDAIRRKVVEHYSPETFSAAMQKLYGELINPRI